MKRLFLSILLCVFVWGMKAQEMDAVFVAMPDQYVPQLENAWRKDLIDLYNSGKEAKLKNTMNGFSTLKKLTDDYLLLQVTERSTVEMKLLPLVNDTYVVCMITTVYGPVPDSQVEFFTTDWKLLDSADLYTPVPVEWFIKDDADKNRTAFIEATARLDMDLRKYSLSPDDQTLTVEYTTPQYLTKTERKQHSNRDCRQGGVLIALSLDGVQHLCAGTGAIAGHAAGNDVGQGLFGHAEADLILQPVLRVGAVDITQVLRNGVIEDDPADGGIHQTGALHTINDHGAADLDGSVQGHNVLCVGHQGLVLITEDLACTLFVLTNGGQVVAAQDHILSRNGNRCAVRGLQQVAGSQHAQLCQHRHGAHPQAAQEARG